MKLNLKKHTVYLSLAGSHSYGTSTPESDLDIKRVLIPPKEFYLGYVNNVEQVQSKDELKVFKEYLPEQFKSQAETLDGSVFEIQKFFKLASDCNPNVLECLFIKPEHMLYINPVFQNILDSKHLFLSKKANFTFRGYLISQFKRIKTHREWLMNPPKKKPERLDFGLSEHKPLISKETRDYVFAMVQKKIDSWNLDLDEVKPAKRDQIVQTLQNYLEDIQIDREEQFRIAARSIGLKDDILSELDKERKYKQALDYYNQYLSWKENRNPKRAALEAKMGFDGKHASMIYRLAHSCREILENHTLNVYREDAKQILAIRNGAWSYERLMEFAETQDKELLKLSETSTLPKGPDNNKLDSLCIQTIEAFYDKSN